MSLSLVGAYKLGFPPGAGSVEFGVDVVNGLISTVPVDTWSLGSVYTLSKYEHEVQSRATLISYT